MANIFDYLLWRGDLTFEQVPFNPVDNIIFSQLSYLPLDGIVPGIDEKEGISLELAAEIFAQRTADNTLQGRVVFKEDPALINALGKTSRFKNCLLHSYVSRLDIAREEQFAALCIKWGGATFIAYRGTDANPVGWKEDFNMSFCAEIPAQFEAVSYLEKVAKKIRGPLVSCGHSKGGNLAIYAASSCTKKNQQRIKGVYSNDAPGFHRRFIESEGFRRMCRRIHSFIPQFSVVGMLFEHGKDYTVIKSSQAGLFQHGMYSWEVTHNDMVRLDSITQGSRFVDKTLREWLSGLDYERRRQFSEILFGILNDVEIKSFLEDDINWPKIAFRMIRSLGNTDRTVRKEFLEMLAALFTAARNNIATLLPENARAEGASGGTSGVPQGLP